MVAYLLTYSADADISARFPHPASFRRNSTLSAHLSAKPYYSRSSSRIATESKENSPPMHLGTREATSDNLTGGQVVGFVVVVASVELR